MVRFKFEKQKKCRDDEKLERGKRLDFDLFDSVTQPPFGHALVYAVPDWKKVAKTVEELLGRNIKTICSRFIHWIFRRIYRIRDGRTL